MVLFGTDSSDDDLDRFPRILPRISMIDSLNQEKKLGANVRAVKFNALTNKSSIEESVFYPKDLKENQILVRVKAASLNKLDEQVRRIRMNDKKDFKYGVGCEFSGIVIEVGKITVPMIEYICAGDFVSGLSRYDDLRKEGSLATYIIVDLKKDIILKAPLINDPFRSCSWLYSYIYAREFVARIPMIRKTMVILVNGGNSDVGIMIVQMLRRLFGVRSVIVADTSNRMNSETKRQIGTQFVINGDQELLYRRVLCDEVVTKILCRKSLDGHTEKAESEILDIHRAKLDVIIDLVGNDVLMFSSKKYLLSKANGGAYLRQTGYKGIDRKLYNGPLQIHLWNVDVPYIPVEFPTRVHKRNLKGMREFIHRGIICPIVPHKNRVKGLDNHFVALDKVTDPSTVGSSVLVTDI